MKIRKFLMVVCVFLVVALPCFSFSVFADSLSVTKCLQSNGTRVPYTVSSNAILGNVETFYNTSTVHTVRYYFNIPASWKAGQYVNVSYTMIFPKSATNIDFFLNGQQFNVTSFYQDWETIDSEAYRFSGSFTYNFSSDVSNCSLILQYTDATTLISLAFPTFTYSVGETPGFGAQKTIDEDYDYSEPAADNTEDGLSSGTNLLDSMIGYLDGFSDEIDTATDNLLDNIQGVKTTFHTVYDVIPDILQYLIVFSLVFLVIRKVVGR